MAGKKRILFSVRTESHLAAVERVSYLLARDDRLAVAFAPMRKRLFRPIRAAGFKTVYPFLAALTRWDLVVSTWPASPSRRAGRRVFFCPAVLPDPLPEKNGFGEFDRILLPGPMAKRRLINKGAVDESLCVEVGMPRLDPLVDGSIERMDVLGRLGLPLDRPTILYVPEWNGSDRTLKNCEAVVGTLAARDWNVLMRFWAPGAEFPHYNPPSEEQLRGLHRPNLRVLREIDITPHLFVADALLTDGNSPAVEYTLLDRPIVFLPRLEKLRADEVVGGHDADVRNCAEVLEKALAHPEEYGEERRAVAADAFCNPGTATRRAIEEIHQVVGMEPRD